MTTKERAAVAAIPSPLLRALVQRQTELIRTPTVGMPDAHDSIGAGCYRARALPGAE